MCDPEAFERAIALISEGLAKGQSPQHIIAANPGAMPFGIRSLYNYLGGAGMGNPTELDLPRAVRYKPRSKSRQGNSSNILREALEGNAYIPGWRLKGRGLGKRARAYIDIVNKKLYNVYNKSERNCYLWQIQILTFVWTQI